MSKIALLSDWFLPHQGGIEIQMHDLAQQLTLAGHEVHVLTPIPGSTHMSGFRVQRLHAPLMPQIGLVYTAHAFRELAQLLRREAYAVVHCHVSYIAPMAFGATYLSQTLGLPTVVTFHSALTQLAHGLALVNRWMHWSAWPILFSGVSRLVNRAVEWLVQPKPVHLLPNGLELAFWQQVAPRPPNESEVVLVTVTRFSPRKRVGALLKIIAAMRAQLPALRLKLLVAGDGWQRPALERLVARLGLRDVVEFLGYQPRTAIREILSRAQIFVSACAIESFGLAALEARSAGLPVVARASGVNQFIQHGREGLLATTDAALAQHLVALIRDPARCAAMAAYNRANPPAFDWAHVLPRHIALYQAAQELV